MSKPNQDNPPSILLNKYEIRRLLGRGTFAKVYEARSLPSHSPVAIKILHKSDLLSHHVSSARILDEVSAMRRLHHHPNIVRLHEVLATRSKIFLVMDLAPGGDLLSLLARRGRLPEPTAANYFHQILSALRFCHARGVAHRDVKPQNVLFARDGTLKVSDFGLSALPENRREDGMLVTACGTPAYAAPEIARRKPYDGARADAWSCGVILFVLLAGYLPFDDSNLSEMYRRIQRRDYRFPPWFSPGSKRIISRLLDPNPESRISIDAVAELSWFRRANSLGDSFGLSLALPEEGKPMSARAINAFDIISESEGLDLSRLFDEEGKGRRERERRFTSTKGVEAVVGRIEEVGRSLGFVYERRKEGGGMRGEGRWGAAMVVEIGEVAPAMLLVTVRMEGGSWKEERVGGVCWEDLKAQLGEVVFAWH